MSQASQVKEEYEIQLYGFSLEEMKSETAEMVKHEINKYFEKLCSSAGRSIESPEAKDQFEQKKGKILGEITKAVEQNLSKYFQDIDKFLSIPSYVLLPENRMHDLASPQYTEEDEVALEQEFEAKRRLFEENIVLLNEMTKVMDISTRLEPALNQETALQDKAQETIHEGTDTSALNDNLQNIKEIIKK